MYPNVMNFCQIPKQLDRFITINEKFEQIFSGLNKYLETKRMIFPRF